MGTYTVSPETATLLGHALHGGKYVSLEIHKESVWCSIVSPPNNMAMQTELARHNAKSLEAAIKGAIKQLEEAPYD